MTNNLKTDIGILKQETHKYTYISQGDIIIKIDSKILFFL